MTSVSDPLVGHALEGRYRITERIARGGMATVYLATDLRLTRTVAVKVMHVGLGDDDDFARKFDREARSAAKLCHPNVVSVFDQGIDNGRPFIVMEYVHGRTLRSLMRQGDNATRGSEGLAGPRPMDPVRALTIMEAVLCALAAAHESGLVHRDIKPENVLISDANQVKVADFGLAKAVSAQTSTATAGLLIGTVSYLPPELVTTGKADPRSDVYSAGVVLYELLTGQKPHTGDTPIQVAYAHVHNDVPAPSEHAPSIPDYLDALVRHATARNPEERPHDARVFLSELRTVRARLRSGVTADSELTEVIATGSPEVDEWNDSTGIRVRQRYMPADYNPRTQLSPRSASTPDDPDYSTVLAPPSTHAPVERHPRTPVERRRDAPRRRRRGWIALVLVLVLTVGVGVGSWWFVSHRQVATPILVNLTTDDARGQLVRLGLTAGDTTEEYSETIPAGSVVRTDPAAGTEVKPGTAVGLVVSKGPERYPAPKLVGTKLTDAKAALLAAHLKVGKVTETWDEKVAAGIVLKASVAEGTSSRPGTTVDLTVSKGPQPIAISDWTGKGGDDAKKALEKLGFKVKVTEKYHDTVAQGKVISQDPKKGNGKRGDTITLEVSKGPELVVVPNVKGMPLASATQTLKDKGFLVTREPVAGGIFGLVHHTNPEGGTKARKGSTITLYYV